MNIRGDKVLITGGCGAIGMAMARAFLEHGKSVVLADIVTAPGEALAAERKGVSVVKVDLGDAEDIERALRPHIEANGAPDILCNNVGVSPKTDAQGKRWAIADMPMAEWDRVMALNVRSYVHVTQICIGGMIARGYGRIINTGSHTARWGGNIRNTAHYVGSKSAVIGLTKQMAIEGAAHGITANCINPGRIRTAMNDDLSEEQLRSFTADVVLGRLGTPEDVAGAALFLASDLANYMTGTSLEVNGGLYMGP